MIEQNIMEAARAQLPTHQMGMDVEHGDFGQGPPHLFHHSLSLHNLVSLSQLRLSFGIYHSDKIVLRPGASECQPGRRAEWLLTPPPLTQSESVLSIPGRAPAWRHTRRGKHLHNRWYPRL